ncbi:MAG: hypothetical protein ACTIIH_14170 [Brevibacterium sp.]|uniref:hypothetical protein n=1 Tax=Brevibacterium sp. TaxID=1701 RepID=UPI003F92FE2A
MLVYQCRLDDLHPHLHPDLQAQLPQAREGQSCAHVDHPGRGTSRGLRGSITLFVGFLIATSVPFYLLFAADANIDFGEILTGFLAVFAVCGVFYVVEPLTYFPILGPAGMYQAFMIGNVSNKLLPSAIVAQDAIGAKPGTRKGEYAATAPISWGSTHDSMRPSLSLRNRPPHSRIPAKMAPDPC